MRFSTLATFAPWLSVFAATTPTLAVDTTDDPNNVTWVDPANAETGQEQVSSLVIHKFTALWNFEVDNDFTETSELIAQIEEAFLLSANEVHNLTDIKFLSAFIKSSFHEHLSSEDDGTKRRTLLHNDGEVYDYDDQDNIEQPDDAANENTGHEKGTGFLRRPRKPKDDFMWRPSYNTLTSVACSFCLDAKDNATTGTLLANPFEQGSGFYQHGSGRDIQLVWQKKFCQKLRSIQPLRRAKRCFIYLDLDHEEPGDNDASSAFAVSEI